MPIDGPRRLEILAALTVALCLGWAIAGLAFRFALYGTMPVTPGDPYGEADVMELIHVGVLLVFCGLSVLEGVLFLVLRHFQLGRLGVFLCVFGMGLAFVYQPIHAWVAASAGP